MVLTWRNILISLKMAGTVILSVTVCLRQPLPQCIIQAGVLACTSLRSFSSSLQ